MKLCSRFSIIYQNFKSWVGLAVLLYTSLQLSSMPSCVAEGAHVCNNLHMKSFIAGEKYIMEYLYVGLLYVCQKELGDTCQNANKMTFW